VHINRFKALSLLIVSLENRKKEEMGGEVWSSEENNENKTLAS